MKLKKKRTLKTIALNLNISITKVTDLWRQLKTSRLQNLVTLRDEIIDRIALNDYLYQCFTQIVQNSIIRTKTLRQLYDEAKTMAKNERQFSFSFFFSAFKKFGFQHRSIRYELKPAKSIDGWHLQSFLNVYLYFLFFQKRFRIIFIDESSICPNNFKKKAWWHKSERSIIKSGIKYEKIMLLGAMSQKQMVGLQLLHSGLNKEVFTNFVYQVVMNQIPQLEVGQQIVLFMDNCSSHRYQNFLEFCRLNNIILFFNLPHKSDLNPIEYLWEFVKRPLRKLTTYKR